MRTHLFAPLTRTALKAILRRRRLLTLLGCFGLTLLLTLLPMHGAALPATSANPSPAISQQPASQPLLQQGQTQYESRQYTEAAATWSQVAQAAAAQGDRLTQASCLSNLALAYQQLGQWEAAEGAIAQSLTLINDLTATADSANTFAQIWNTQGNLFLAASQPAYEAFVTATDYYRQANDPDGILRSQLNQAQALQALGFYRRALLILTDLTPPLAAQPDSPLKVTGLKILGDLQRSVGDLEASQRALEQGLATAQNLQIPNDVAALSLSLGHTAEAQGNLEQALSQYQQAAAIATTLELQLRSQLSQLPLLRKNNQTADIANLSRQIEANLANAPVERIFLNARLDFAQQQLADSLAGSTGSTAAPQTIAQNLAQNLAIARQQAKTLNDPRAESYALGILGELYVQQQQFTDAQSTLQQALSIANKLNAPDIAYQWQWQLAQLARQQKDTAQALVYYENAVENLNALRGNLIAIAPDLRFNFQEQVEPVYREWVDLLLSESTDPSTDSSTDSLTKARDALESLQLAELENFFQEPCLPVSQEIDRIIENTASPTAVIYPIILADRLEIILTLPHQPLQQYTIPIPQAQLETFLQQFQRDLLLPYSLNAVKTEAAQLYDWLIRPTETALANSQIDTLVFVLDGFLRSIPMAALYDGKHYLVETYSIALAPGLQLIDPRPLQRREQTLNTLIAGLSESRHGFAALPAVQTEVAQVQKNTTSRVLLNETFTESNLTNLINDSPFPLVHLATHGQFSSNPNDTFILAWDKPIQVNEFNRLLRQSEQAHQGAIELLILSACETAAGDKRAGLGLAGIAVQAGARSTLASLWSLDDETSALFSNYFYQALQTPNLSKAQALRNAQRQFIDDSNNLYQHPRYWAPYVLLGNWL
jgi:CHAT domain-containing protein